MNHLQTNNVEFRSLDGLRLRGTVATPQRDVLGTAILVHGITVNRDEVGGFNVRLAERLGEAGIRSLRFDLRGHGESDGTQQDVTLCTGLSDIAAAFLHLRETQDITGCHLVGASFGGGLAALYAARNAGDLESLVLLNPNLDYRESWLARDPYWNGASLTPSAAEHLRVHGWLEHGEFRIGRPLLHELIHVSPVDAMRMITTPTLTFHGTEDSVVPYDISAANYKVAAECKFIAVEGADHGFVTPGDEDGTSPESQHLQAKVFDEAAHWISRFVQHTA